MVLQPSDARRKSGSHYTPRSLTEPIVRTTLQPILTRLGDRATPEHILDLKVCDPAMGSGAFLVEACRLLGDELVKAWHVHDCVPVIPPDEGELLHARRLVAQRCLYGVDKNPMAVDLAKLSLWLATLAKDHPFTFLDHSLRCGDSLVGLTQEQITAFHWSPPKKRSAEDVWFGDPIAERMQRVTAYRQRILAARDDKSYEQLRQELSVADNAMSLAKLTGDLVIAAFFSASKDRQRIDRLNVLARQLVKFMSKQGQIEDALPLMAAAEELRRGARPIEPFHWEFEFPEVFGRENGGFDAFLGNPPFLRGTSISTSNTKIYLDWINLAFPESGDRMDLVAYFFRRAFTLLRYNGTFGLIATNTIAQGDTRKGGLRWICTHGGTLFDVKRRYKWPGQAAVIVTVIHVFKGVFEGRRQIDEVERDSITAFLFHAGGNEDPNALLKNKSLAFNGIYILGMGFTFDDNKSGCSSLKEMNALLKKDPRNAERIFPYIGGEEVNDSPTHEHRRYVINFSSMSEEEAKKWPDLLQIVEDKVKPERLQKAPDVASYPWWRFWRERGEMQSATANLRRIMVCARHQPNWCVAFLPSHVVPSDALVVFALDRNADFSVLQSRIHEIWARFFGSSIKDDLRYTPSDCFETFPFLENFETNARLEAIGKDCYDFRAQLMITNNEGLTKTYNRFHDPYERSPEIQKLRELHNAMDRAVLDAYGWTDLMPTCEFLLDYEEDEDDEDGASRRKKPWRYRWPDDFRDEVLARLLELNKQRTEQERLNGLAAEAARTKRGNRVRSKAKDSIQSQRQSGESYHQTLELLRSSES
jgi:hypothetical protein